MQKNKRTQSVAIHINFLKKKGINKYYHLVSTQKVSTQKLKHIKFSFVKETNILIIQISMMY